MHLIVLLLSLVVTIGALTVPPTSEPSSISNTFPEVSPPVAQDSASRYRCGSFKFDDGTTQDMVSQVWSGRPFDEIICRTITYTRARKDKGGKPANMVAAKIDSGCTCYFFEAPCDPQKGHWEQWMGWEGWDNYAYTKRHFKGWWCYESF